MNKPLTQIYSNYTQEDFKVWKVLFDRQLKNLEHYVSHDFLEALEKVKFTPNRIPYFKEVNSILLEQTGWSLHTVPCISPQCEFFRLLSQEKFTATCWIRKKEQLDYLEEPDMFHDVFAHTPLLSNPTYCEFFKSIGDLALKHIHDPIVIQKFGRLYWFTIEFGMIYKNNEINAFGAGVISSAGETKHALSVRSKKIDFNIEKIFNTNFRADILQENYFVIDSFDQLLKSVPEIEQKIELLAEINT
ncbi:MAG: phenylalanine 4-monooxygenase [Bacteroidota bacterium]|nr:phenylalanine 4-monooxygenase [Bacteroidota bacterium]